jgi:hypothetical protein
VVNRIQNGTGNTGYNDAKTHENGYANIKVLDEHLNTYKDQHNCNTLLQIIKFIHRAPQQKEERTQAEYREDIGGIDYENIIRSKWRVGLIPDQ